MSVEIRRTESRDLSGGLLDVLSELSAAGDINPTRLEEAFRSILANPDYCLWVAIDAGRIVGTIRVLFERKLTRGCGIVAHIEDVVVTHRTRGTGVGALLVEAAVTESIRRACYKVILDCSEPNVLFYEKCGFHRHEVGMRMDVVLGDHK